MTVESGISSLCLFLTIFMVYFLFFNFICTSYKLKKFINNYLNLVFALYLLMYIIFIYGLNFSLKLKPEFWTLFVLTNTLIIFSCGNKLLAMTYFLVVSISPVTKLNIMIISCIMKFLIGHFIWLENSLSQMKSDEQFWKRSIEWVVNAILTTMIYFSVMQLDNVYFLENNVDI